MPDILDDYHEFEEVTLPGGQKLVNVHNREVCKGRNCCIHNPSDTVMKDWPQNWRSDMKKMERICIHGVGHDDPDDLYYRQKSGREASGIHGCCPERCCDTAYDQFHDWLGG